MYFRKRRGGIGSNGCSVRSLSKIVAFEFDWEGLLPETRQSIPAIYAKKKKGKTSHHKRRTTKIIPT